MAFDESTEEWRTVEGFLGYEVSSLGRIRSIARKARSGRSRSGFRACRARHIKTRVQRRGYIGVILSINGKKTSLFVHRLVCTAFNGPPPSAVHQVNHKNGIRSDNAPKNLEWSTASENIKHSREVLGKMPPNGAKHYRAIEVDTSKIEQLLATGISQADTRRVTGATRKIIASIAHGKHWSQRPPAIG